MCWHPFDDNFEFNTSVSALAFNPVSDRNAKKDLAQIDPVDILARVAELPITTWVFKDDDSTRHLGPMAQDFHAAFRLGSSDTRISTTDADGVALAAIQGLKELVDQQAVALEEKDRELRELRDVTRDLATRLQALEATTTTEK